MKLKCDKTSKIVREMTDSEKAESIINLINHKDINAEYLYNWQIDAIKEMCEKQIARTTEKDIVVDEDYSGSIYEREIPVCPSCHNIYLMLKQKYCNDCGQKLDWSVEE